MLLAKRVTGEEEVPEGCVAVVTPDAPDVLSHVSVRARNMRVLFAICHESGPLQEIENLAGKVRTDKAGPTPVHRHRSRQHVPKYTSVEMVLWHMSYPLATQGIFSQNMARCS